MPTVRPFRALRFAQEATPDLSRVVSPPYDIISPDQQRDLLARDERNVVRLDLPTPGAGEEPDERYRRAARTLAAWRSDGTLRKDRRPSLYLYEVTSTLAGSAEACVQRGFFGRLRLEPFGPDSGVRPHERTLAGPREDRYRLLRATGVNTSPVVAMYEDESGESARLIDALTAGPLAAEVVDDDDVRHRLWVVPADADPSHAVARLTDIAGANPITIADGHHRYETALRYRDERRMSRSCEEDPAFDYLLTLLLEWTGQRLIVLPTHRVIRNLAADAEVLAAAAGELFKVAPASRAELDGWGAGAAGGRGRFGLWTRSGGFVLTARRADFEPWLPAGGAAVRALDVTLLGVALERLLGIGADAVAAGDRVAYTKSAAEAIAIVDSRSDGADVAFLLESTPVASIVQVAADGDVMPQKSTYFHPKPLTGLVINPHEW